MAGQKTRVRKAKAGAAEGQAFIDKTKAALAEANAAPAPEPKRRKGIEAQVAEAGVTEEGIVQARDKDGLSWADVAKTVGLNGPGAARKAYELLTGRNHATSIMTGKRAPRGSRSGAGVLRPQWDNDTDTDEITEAIERRRIFVYRPFMPEPEEINVATVLYYDTMTNGDDPKPMDLTLTFTQGRWVRDAKGGGEHLAGNEVTQTRSVFVKDIVEVR